jgi:hypothetical protein
VEENFHAQSKKTKCRFELFAMREKRQAIW